MRQDQKAVADGDGQYSKPKHVQSLFDFAEGGRGGVAPRDPFTKIMVAEFDRRRRVMVDRLNRMPGVTCSMPTGAFYAFPNVSGLLARRWKDRPHRLRRRPGNLFAQRGSSGSRPR